MPSPLRYALGTLVVAAASLSNQNLANQDAATMSHAKGPFDVKLSLLDTYNKSDASMARRSIDKIFHGDLDATSQGEMLSTGSAANFGGYVAIERVSGALSGRKGTFALQHNATMTNGTPYLNIIVVPGSGTGELAGLSGKMSIDIAPGGAHSYTFDYTIDGEK
jgi:hypothetical protein